MQPQGRFEPRSMPGVPLCIGCHTRGRDGVLTEHPLD
jgi:hypothetical protein